MLNAIGLSPGKRLVSRGFWPFRRVIKARDGAAATEFALVAPILVLTLVGVIEVGAAMFVGALMEGAVREGARYGITGQGGPGRLQAIRDIIEDTTVGMVDISVADITTMTYDSFEDIGAGEPFTDDNPANGVWDVGEAYADVNGNGEWDDDQGKEGVGDPGEIVLYEITYGAPLLTGMITSHFGYGGIINLKSTIAVRNEPYNDEAVSQ